MLITKRSKSPNLAKNPKALNLFLQEVDRFRKRRRFSQFMKPKPFTDYFTDKRRQALEQFVIELEALRCESLGMGEFPFYRIVAEFIVEPSKRHYYNPVHLFGATANWEADEFRSRIFHTMVAIARYVNSPVDSVPKFIQEIMDLKSKVDVSEARKGTKDWFCLKATLQRSLEKGLTSEDMVEKMRLHYKRRIKKVYPEMVLRDVFSGELDQTLLNNKEELSETSQEWLDEWAKDN